MTILSGIPLSGFCGCCSGLVSQASASDNKTQDCCYVPAIQGMTCESCAVHVQKALNQVPGVAQAKVNFRNARAEVHPKPGSRLTADALTKAVEKTGYRVKVIQRSKS
jgi:copper chaperone CopZ